MNRKTIIAFLILLTTLFLANTATTNAQNTASFECVGVPQYFSVPPGVTQLQVQVIGADGDNNETRTITTNGGRGANVETFLRVVAGQLLTINVGCVTGYGAPRGGATNQPDYKSPQYGGGASSIVFENNYVVVAGGGGAAGKEGFFIQSAPGGKGGDALQNTGNGQQGSGSSGGQGGTFAGAGTSNGGNGAAGQANGIGGGGGGGGGYNGQGGGGGQGGSGGSPGAGGGGGGGASFVNAAFANSFSIQNSDEVPDGRIVISYNGPSAAPLTFSCSNSSQTYTVPSGVRQLRVVGAGADGGDYIDVQSSNGDFANFLTGGSGKGALKTADINVTPGEQLLVEVGCVGKLPSIGGASDSINPGGAGGFGFINGGRGGDGDKPPLTRGAGGGAGGGGATGIGRNIGIFVAAGGGGGGGEGAFTGCNPGMGGAADGRSGGDAAPCANKGIGGLTAGGGNINGGSGCSFCSSGGGGGAGGGFQYGQGGTAGGIGLAGGGGGGGGGSYVGAGGSNFSTLNDADRRTVIAARQFGIIQSNIIKPLDGILMITPIFRDSTPPVVSLNRNAAQPDGDNGWYRSSVAVSWTVTSTNSPITNQTGCVPLTVSADTPGATLNCSATNAFGTTSGSTTIKRDATPPNVTASARTADNQPYTFGTVTNQPVTVTYTCADGTSGIRSCSPPQTFGSNGTATATAIDNAGNASPMNFGNVLVGNQPPTISTIADLNLNLNTSSGLISFTVGDNETPAANLNVTAVSSNQGLVLNGCPGICLQSNSGGANRTIQISPLRNKIGTTLITVTVRDTQGATASTTFTVSINCGTITLQQGNGGINAVYGGFYDNGLIPAGGVAPYSIALVNGALPQGLNFASDYTRISGDAVTQLGNYPLTFQVTDAVGCMNISPVVVSVDCLTNYTVSNNNDFDLRSLRFAVEGVCPNSTIDFSQGLNGLTIPIEDNIEIAKPLTIQGPGANKITLNNTSPPGMNKRIFYVRAATTISGLTISGGNTSNNPGGGIYMLGGNLTLKDSVVTNNRGSYGGGIGNNDVNSTLTVINSTISNNIGFDANNLGNNGGGIRSLGPVNIVNSTVSGNIAGGQFGAAGGIYAASGTISNSTVTNNEVANTPQQPPINSAGGIISGSSNSALNVRSTIIAGNRNNGQIPDVFNLFTSGGYNFIGNRGAVTAFNQTGDQTGTSAAPLNPMLDVLRLNGGTTPTHAFLSMSSPAVDKGNSFGLTTDQRGIARPYDNPSIANAPNGDGADIGAFEMQMITTAADISVGGRVLTTAGRGLTNASVMLTDANGASRTARTTAFGYYRFDNVHAGQTYVLSVVSKRYTFNPQVVTINEDAEDLNFTAEGK